MLIEIETAAGLRKIRVCDYCRAVCIPSGRFCSGHCARNFVEAEAYRRDSVMEAERITEADIAEADPELRKTYNR